MREIKSGKLIRILFKKEMKDIFRDRKSVLLMFFVPIVLYPLIFFVAFLIVSMMQTGVGTQTYRIVMDSVPDSRLEDTLEKQREDAAKVNSKSQYQYQFYTGDDFEKILRAIPLDDSDTKTSENADVTSIKPASDDELREYIARTLKQEVIDAYVRYRDGTYRLYYNSSVTNSSGTASLIESALADVKQNLVIENLEGKGLDADEILNPISLEEQDTATSEQSLGYFLGTIIPFMMILSLLVGVFTPAIDATTGEKERGTLETLLMMPVSNSQIIVAKFFSVALVGLITTLLSVASMAGLGAYMLSLITATDAVNFGGIDVGTFIPAILVTIPVLIVLSLFLTAVSMCVTCFAKSYKEANTYMSPVMIVVMLTGYIGFIPNIDFDRTMAMIPVANVCLLIKNLLLFKVNFEMILIVIISTAAYTGLVILLLGRMYKSEAILFDEGRGGLALLERRSNMKRGGVPGTGDGWFVLVISFLLLMYAGGLLQAHLGLNGVAWTQAVLVAFPVIMALYTKKSMKNTFSLRVPDISRAGSAEAMTGNMDGREIRKASGVLRACIGSLILGIGAIAFSMVISSVMYQVFEQEGQAVSDSILSIMQGPGLWIWIVVAVLPGICEEALFRGYLLSAFGSRYKTGVTVLLVAVTFGIFHTSLVRFPATAFLGGAFAYICIKTGSIFPGMILHCCNNSIAVLGFLFPTWMEEHLPFLTHDVLDTGTMLIAGSIGVVGIVGGALLLMLKKKC